MASRAGLDAHFLELKNPQIADSLKALRSKIASFFKSGSVTSKRLTLDSLLNKKYMNIKRI
jgi:hypothetical protein